MHWPVSLQNQLTSFEFNLSETYLERWVLLLLLKKKEKGNKKDNRVLCKGKVTENLCPQGLLTFKKHLSPSCLCQVLA